MLLYLLSIVMLLYLLLIVLRMAPSPSSLARTVPSTSSLVGTVPSASSQFLCGDSSQCLVMAGQEPVDRSRAILNNLQIITRELNDANWRLRQLSVIPPEDQRGVLTNPEHMAALRVTQGIVSMCCSTYSQILAAETMRVRIADDQAAAHIRNINASRMRANRAAQRTARLAAPGQLALEDDNDDVHDAADPILAVEEEPSRVCAVPRSGRSEHVA